MRYWDSSPTSCPNEAITLKLIQLNHQMTFCIWGRPHWIQDGNFSTLDYFLLFLVTGLVDSCPESLNSLNIQNTEKQMWLDPKVASRFAQNFLRVKSKTENLLFWKLILLTFYFPFIPANFYLLFGCPIANFWLLSRK